MKIIKVFFLFLLFGFISLFSSLKGQSLKKDEIVLSGTPLGNPNDVLSVRDFIVKDSLIAVSGYDGNHFLHLFNYKKWKHIGDFIEKGNGPGESGMTPVIFIPAVKRATISLYDFSKLAATTVDLIPFENLESISFNNGFVAPPELGTPSAMYYLTKNTVLGKGAVNCKFFLAKGPDSELVQIPYLPEIHKRKDYRYLFAIYNGTIDVKPDGKYFAYAMNSFNRIEIYDINGKINYVCSNPVNKNTDVELSDILDDENRTIFFKDVAVTNKYIYGLFFGFSGKEAQHLLKKSNPFIKILVFNWKGDFVKTIVLNKIITLIDVDENDEVLIGFNPFDEEYPLWKFNLE